MTGTSQVLPGLCRYVYEPSDYRHTGRWRYPTIKTASHGHRPVGGRGRRRQQAEANCPELLHGLLISLVHTAPYDVKMPNNSKWATRHNHCSFSFFV